MANIPKIWLDEIAKGSEFGKRVERALRESDTTVKHSVKTGVKPCSGCSGKKE